MPREKRPSDGEIEHPTKRSAKTIARMDPEKDEEDPEQFEIEAIVGHEDDARGRRKYCVKWKGYSSARNTYEPMENLSDCSDLLDDYEKKVADAAEANQEPESDQAKESEPESNSSNHEVESIAGYKDTYDGRLYLIKWKGYSLTEGTWESEENLNHCQELLEKFWAKKGGRIPPPVIHNHQRAAKSASKTPIKPDVESKKKTRKPNVEKAKPAAASSKKTGKAKSPVRELAKSTGKKRLTRTTAAQKAAKEEEAEEQDTPEDGELNGAADAENDEIVYNGIGGTLHLITGDKFFEAWIDRTSVVPPVADSASVAAPLMQAHYPEECSVLLKRLKNRSRKEQQSGKQLSQSSAKSAKSKSA